MRQKFVLLAAMMGGLGLFACAPPAPPPDPRVLMPPQVPPTPDFAPVPYKPNLPATPLRSQTSSPWRPESQALPWMPLTPP